MEMATGYRNTRKIIASTNQHIQCTPKINAVKMQTKAGKYCTLGEDNNIKQQQKIKIYINNKLKNLKFLINLYLNIILCISKTKQNNSMLTTTNNQQTCIIKWLENEKIFNIILQFIRKIIWNFLTKLKIHSGIIENVKIKKILHTVRHLVGICLIRLISLKILQQIPENHQEKQEKLLTWQIVGNAENKNQTKSYDNNIKSILWNNLGNEKENWLLQYNSSQVATQTHKIVGNSENCQNYCFPTSQYIENEEDMLQTQKIECYQVGNSQASDIYNNQYKSSYLTTKCVINKEKTRQIKKRECHQVGNYQHCLINKNSLYCKEKTQRDYYHHLSRRRESETAQNSTLKGNYNERYLCERGIEENAKSSRLYFHHLSQIKKCFYQKVGNARNKKIKENAKDSNLNSRHQEKEWIYFNGHYLTQTVGNAQNCVSKEIGNNFDVNKTAEEKSQFYLKHLNQRVGNYQRIRSFNDITYFPSRNINEMHAYCHRLRQRECHIVGNSQNYLTKERNKNIKGNVQDQENIQLYYQHLSYIDKMKYESVANLLLFKENYYFSRDIEKHYFGHLSHFDKILYQINAQKCKVNETHVNITEKDVETKIKQPDCCCHLRQATKIRYREVGNALNFELKQTKKDVCLKRKERNYEIVGNSLNYIHSNDNYAAKENEKDDNNKPHFDNYYQLSEAVMNFHTKVGNSQIHQHLNNNGTLINKEIKERETQFANKNKLSLGEKRENQLVDYSLNCKYFKDTYKTMQNVKQDKRMLLYPYNKNTKMKRQLNNCNQLRPIENRELKKVGNTTDCQYLTNYAVTENEKEAEQKYLYGNYRGLNQVPDNTYKIVDNIQIFSNKTENELLYHTKDKHKKYTQSLFHSSQNYTHTKFNHRQNQHFKHQVNCEPECHRFSVLYTFYYYFCWHAVCGFPLKSREFFKYLNDLTVRKLTWLKTLPSMADYNNDAPSSLCGRKLTKPTRKVKVDIIAKQKDCVKISQTSIQRTKSTFTTTVASLSSLHSPTSASSFSTSLSATSSTRMNLATTTPYCHNQQQPHHHHHHYNYYHNSPTTTTTTTNRTTSYLKLPSLLLLSRTLIILILLSSLWHTSEGFHSTGVKLSPNTVKTKYGLVRGIVVRSSPSLVEAYLGIPYASPPVGSLRFMPPITPSTWKNVRNADRFSPVCPQTVPIPPNGPEALLEVPRARLAQLRRLLPLLSNQSEDCLYLNIYAPYENRRNRRFTTNSGESNDSPKIPTILFIHGESYEWNSGNPYDGSEMAAHGNVIVVTINFRLGIFGFLKTGGKESAQGNFGLMDLVAGLHWLKENLPAFGGDPQAITLLGHGTGAALANILAVSPVASDLIQHSVLVSGSALSPWAIQKNPLFVKRRVAEQTGCHGDMLYDDLAPCLRTKTANELLGVKIDHPRFLVGFAPFIDGTVISPNSDSIGKLSLPLGSAIVSTSGIEFANFPKRNLIFCLTSVESHLDLSAQDLEFGFNETRRDRILRTYVRNNFHYHLNEIFAVLKNEYTDWDKAIRSPLSSRDATLQFLSDGHTASSLIKLGYMHSLRGGRGYFLHFKHRTIEEEYPQRTGSVRGEDVPFWLGLPISPLFPHNYTTQEKQISRLMLRYLANFAKTGNPNQSSVSSPLPSSSSLIEASSSSPPSAHSDDHQKVKRSSSSNIENSTSLIRGPIVVDVATATAREALNLAVLYNQRRTKRTYNKRHSRSNDDHSGSDSNEMSYISNANSKLDGDELPFWDAYDVVNQLYMELGNKAEIQSHYRGHKLSMWLNLIPQLHRHANMNDQSMRHHQFQDDLNNMNLYEGIVRAQTQIKPADDEETLLLPKGRTTPPPVIQETNTTQKPIAGTTECGVDGAMFVAEMTTTSPSDNRSLVMDSREKEMATASTGLIGNLEVLRRLSGKQFQSYTTALVATVAVGCFLLILNILIFAGIYHQREKRARDAKTKEELQDNDTSKNSSMLKLNAMGSESGSFNDSGAGVSGKTTVVFGEYSCYDEKSLQTKDEKLIVELPPPQMLDSNWAACSTSTLDLLKTKHHVSLEATFPLSNVVPITTTEQQQTEHLMAVNALEMSTYNPLPMGTGLIIDPSMSAAATSTGLLSKRGSFIGSSSQLNQYDFASVQSSDQMSFKDIENAVKVSVTRDDDITQDDDIPEPPPPPRSFQSMQHQQAQHNLQLAHQQQGTTTSVGTSASGGGILRQAGTSSATQTGGGKKRVHIQEISV